MTTTEAVKERPILFSGEMVGAILAGRKTQTRRVVKNPRSSLVDVQAAEWVERYTNAAGFNGCWSFKQEMNRQHPSYGQRLACNSIAIDTIRCPYGEPGDRLWVREAWQPFHDDELYTCIRYRADDGRMKPTLWTNEQGAWCETWAEGNDNPWRPSIHMPRWASRITLEIEQVRVERLQDISESDAQAEGFSATQFPGPWWQGYREVDGELMHQQFVGEQPPEWMIEPHRMKDMNYLDRSAVEVFRGTWDVLNHNRGYGWEANPWVWVIEFKRLMDHRIGGGS